MGAALYERPPDPRELAAFGLTPDDVAGDPVEIWPENETAFLLFFSLRSQWLVGMAGATGLNYVALFHKMDRMGLSPEQYVELEDQVRVLEFAALDERNRK
ncbi:DUF1799 domain-containing protein [Achromobacter piechaudii]|uniref:DUF1799 domain-containing protein n=1 Tax=Achromobacter piechaudii TaxID=72556 RepID=UPI0023EE7497|nr:DUF1799 domain-containing protein [Achromobacter piechaudii]